MRTLILVAVASILALIGFHATQPIDSQAAPAPVEAAYVYVPPTAVRSAPLQVVVAVHGVGDNGKNFGSQLIEQANGNDWVIVAPTIHYGNWWNVDELVHEDVAFAHWLVAYLNNLPAEAGVVPRERVLLFGFSRGAGVIGRFSLMHPGRVLAAAALSSGAYTLPTTRDEKGRPLAFPFGVADLATHGGGAFDAHAFGQTRWFVGVGDADADPQALPQVWTPFIGSTRVERARKFSAALRATTASATLRIFPETRHVLTPEMRSEALSFLRDTEPPRPVATPIPAAGTHLVPTPGRLPGATASAGTTPVATASQRSPVGASPTPNLVPDRTTSAEVDAAGPQPRATVAEPPTPAAVGATSVAQTRAAVSQAALSTPAVIDGLPPARPAVSEAALRTPAVIDGLPPARPAVSEATLRTPAVIDGLPRVWPGPAAAVGIAQPTASPEGGLATQPEMPSTAVPVSETPSEEAIAPPPADEQFSESSPLSPT